MPSVFQTASDIMQAGGWVMWLLLALSVTSVALTIERALFWAGSFSGKRSAWVAELTALLRARKHAEAARKCAGDGSVYGMVGGMLAAAQAESASDPAVPPVDEAQAVAVIEAARGRVERFGVTMSTIITAAPMLGILGTVIGIIASFRALDAVGLTEAASANTPVDPARVAGGIATALYTTAFGLIVALVTLFPYAIFRRASERCFAVLEIIATAAVEGSKRGRGAGEPSKAA